VRGAGDRGFRRAQIAHSVGENFDQNSSSRACSSESNQLALRHSSRSRLFEPRFDGIGKILGLYMHSYERRAATERITRDLDCLRPGTGEDPSRHS
jgi:hypothetical protein